MALVGQMLVADPHFVMGHCLKGYLLLSAANPLNAHLRHDLVPPRSDRGDLGTG
jgi:hypothetical protein